MNTPTPGAASELLLPCPFCAVVPMHENVYGDRAAVHPLNNCAISGRVIPAEKWNTRTPAPVTEGAQREAVARAMSDLAIYDRINPTEYSRELVDILAHDVRVLLRISPPPPDRVKPVDGGSASDSTKESYREADDDCAFHDRAATVEYVLCDGSNRVLEYAGGFGSGVGDDKREKIFLAPKDAAPPPPDLVQPERVEADPVAWLVEDKHTVGLVDSSYPDAFPVYRHPAPPTDASGGVTELLRASAALLDVLDEYYFDGEENAAVYGFRHAFNATLEAADRARKQTPVATQPVDASAQAASAVEPVAWQYEMKTCDGWVIRYEAAPPPLTPPFAKVRNVTPLYAAPTPVAAYREVQNGDVGHYWDWHEANYDFWTAESFGEVLRKMGAVIRTTDAPTYRPCTLEDAFNIKRDADGIACLESEAEDLLTALRSYGAVIAGNGEVR